MSERDVYLVLMTFIASNLVTFAFKMSGFFLGIALATDGLRGW